MESLGFVDNGVSLVRVWASDESNQHYCECHFHCHTPLNMSSKIRELWWLRIVYTNGVNILKEMIKIIVVYKALTLRKITMHAHTPKDFIILNLFSFAAVEREIVMAVFPFTKGCQVICINGESSESVLHIRYTLLRHALVLHADKRPGC